jgi:hypothetical protein
VPEILELRGKLAESILTGPAAFKQALQEYLKSTKIFPKTAVTQEAGIEIPDEHLYQILIALIKGQHIAYNPFKLPSLSEDVNLSDKAKNMYDLYARTYELDQDETILARIRQHLSEDVGNNAYAALMDLRYKLVGEYNRHRLATYEKELAKIRLRPGQENLLQKEFVGINPGRPVKHKVASADWANHIQIDLSNATDYDYTPNLQEIEWYLVREGNYLPYLTVRPYEAYCAIVTDYLKLNFKGEEDGNS